MNIDKQAIRFAGDDLMSIVVDSPADGQHLAAQLRAGGNWLEVIAGIASCVVRYDNARLSPAQARDKLVAEIPPQLDVDNAVGDIVDIPVCYDEEFGIDLGSVCRQLGISIDDFVAAHTSAEYAVDMNGFTPGFAYIGGFTAGAGVERLESPRLRVEAGSIGVVDGRSGVYALPGPGGWPIVGRTPLSLFDASAEAPFRLVFGTRVRFRQISRDEFDELASADDK